VVDRYGDREVLVATKDTFLVVILPGEPAADGNPGSRARPPAVEYLRNQLRRHTGDRHWQVATGQPHPGAYGIAQSYEQAREALRLARRLQLDAATIRAADLLLYRVIGRDQAALVDLVHGVLTPLTRARGGAEPLLHTLETYYGGGRHRDRTPAARVSAHRYLPPGQSRGADRQQPRRPRRQSCLADRCPRGPAPRLAHVRVFGLNHHPGAGDADGDRMMLAAQLSQRRGLHDRGGFPCVCGGMNR
jgi:hypothetical protein